MGKSATSLTPEGRAGGWRTLPWTSLSPNLPGILGQVWGQRGTGRALGVKAAGWAPETLREAGQHGRPGQARSGQVTSVRHAPGTCPPGCWSHGAGPQLGFCRCNLERCAAPFPEGLRSTHPSQSSAWSRGEGCRGWEVGSARATCPVLTGGTGND